jgi:hypothetical protein
MSDDTPTEPNQPQPNQPEPYGSPPPPPATNPYAAPPPSSPPPPAAPPSAPPPSYPPPNVPPPAYGSPPPPPGYAAPTYPAGGYPGGKPPAAGAGGLAITGLVFAIAAGVLFWIPFLGILIALVGLVLGVVAWSTAGKNGRPKGIAIAATIVGALAMVGAILVTLFVFYFWDVIKDCTDPNLTSAEQEQCATDRVNDRFGVN